MTYPLDWYWQLEDGRIWSSARRQFVAAGDAQLEAWQSGTVKITKSGTADDVGDALNRIGFAYLAPPCAVTIKAECARRILVVLKDEVTQINLTSYAAGLLARKFEGALSAQDEAALSVAETARLWVTSMRAACRGMIAAKEVDFHSEAKWPAPPEGLAQLVAAL